MESTIVDSPLSLDRLNYTTSRQIYSGETVPLNLPQKKNQVFVCKVEKFYNGISVVKCLERNHQYFLLAKPFYANIFFSSFDNVLISLGVTELEYDREDLSSNPKLTKYVNIKNVL